jgi:hypothetical protein
VLRLVLHVVAISLYGLPSSIMASSSKIASVSNGAGLKGYIGLTLILHKVYANHSVPSSRRPKPHQIGLSRTNSPRVELSLVLTAHCS